MKEKVHKMKNKKGNNRKIKIDLCKFLNMKKIRKEQSE